MFKALIISKSQELFAEGEAVRELPASPYFFGIFTFAVLMLLLYLVMRLDKD